eukprot:TRINITY_DN413_c4_g1_i1.p1 TRINITY_DN413_c4_g1~~TRINITY_DN413_c4_g1_i1.p1  ORF type:complete len:844 (+),score=94.64 TRINITY_DN413_c4_g1_i1:263-2794(+)
MLKVSCVAHLCVLLFTCFPSSSYGSSALSASALTGALKDARPLLAFKATITNDPTGATKDWVLSPQTGPCNWTGITCKHQEPSSTISIGRVIAIDLSGRNISGRLVFGPPSIGRLRYLKSLQLSDNQLEGPIPGTLSLCQSLATIDLSNNRLNDKVPQRLSLLPHLAVLDLHGNQLSGILRRSMASLTRLMELSLRDNLLTGPLPTAGLLGLKQLRLLDLRGNFFSAEIPPALGYLPSLHTLLLTQNSFSGRLTSEMLSSSLVIADFGHNSLSGHLDPTFGNALSKLQSLSLTSNNFTGELPASLKNASSLTTLDLSNNSFSGNLSVLQTLRKLTALSVANNNFSGTVLLNGSLGSFPLTDFSGNPNLCYHQCSTGSPPLSPSPPPSSTTSPTTSSPSTTSPAPPPQPPPPPPGSSGSRVPNSAILSAGVIAAIVVSVVGLIVVTLVCCTTTSTCNAPKGGLDGGIAAQQQQQQQQQQGTSAAQTPGTHFPVRTFTHAASVDLVTMMDSKPIRVEDLLAAVEDFASSALVSSTAVAGGGGRSLFRATFPDQTRAAVKKLPRGAWTSDGEFLALMNRLAGLNHRHVAALDGFWVNTLEEVYLYEYPSKGSVQDFLHQQPPKTKKAKKWAHRYRIALGVARGLAYLHEECSPPVVHADVQPASICLDSAYEAILIGAGLLPGRHHHHQRFEEEEAQQEQEEALSEQFAAGYAAPETLALASARMTAPADVYSYGLVLLELITSRSPSDPYLRGLGESLLGWVRSMLEKNGDQFTESQQVEELFSLVNFVVSEEDEMRQLLKVALLCCSEAPEARPLMSDVVHMIVRARETAEQIRETPQLRDLLI